MIIFVLTQEYFDISVFEKESNIGHSSLESYLMKKDSLSTSPTELATTQDEMPEFSISADR